jgi:glycosyltransferase involved in cell wall biosynthesis
MSQEIMDKDIEILIVDDGSSDNSISIINYFKDNYLCDIKIFKLKKNMGPGYCSNLAVKKSKGDYIIRVDSDDYISKLAIEVMSNILIHNDKRP